MKRLFKRAALVVSVLLLVVVLTMGGYIAYLQIQYYRIEDHTALEVYSPQTAVLQLETPYKAVTCNIGFGAYGQQVAKRLKAFDVQVLAVNRTMKTSPFVDGFYPLEQLDFCLSQADIVILAIALTDETRNLLSENRIASIKPGAILINAARGGLIDEAALAEALKSGHIAGAALDVFADEPLSKDSPLWNTDTVLISPHNSFVGANNHSRLIQCITANLSLPECYHE